MHTSPKAARLGLILHEEHERVLPNLASGGALNMGDLVLPVSPGDPHLEPPLGDSVGSRTTIDTVKMMIIGSRATVSLMPKGDQYWTSMHPAKDFASLSARCYGTADAQRHPGGTLVRNSSPSCALARGSGEDIA